MFDQQVKEMETELEIYSTYKVYTAPTKNETLEQYANLFFYNNKVYLKNALLTDSTRYATKADTFIEQPVTHEPQESHVDDYLTEDIVEEKKRFEEINFVFNKSKHNPFVVGISTQSIRDIT